MHDKNLREFIEQFHQAVLMPGGYTFNHVETLETIELYYNSKFKSGDKDSHGMKKFFYNIVKPACDIATKSVDLDTKDIVLVPENSEDDLVVWLMQKDLKYWIKKNGFAELLNEVGHDFPKYGHVVVKRSFDGAWRKVPIVNLRVDNSCARMEDSAFVLEVMHMTRWEIKQMPWDKEAVEELFKRDPLRNRFCVYECYYQGGKGKRWSRYIKADVLSKREGSGVVETAESQLGQKLQYIPSITLYEDESNDLPYRELKWEAVDGRWLGRGYVEALFDNQVRINELTNIKAKGLYFTSLKVYQTSDDIVQRNLFTDVENGQILKSINGVTPIANEERNLGVFNQEEQRWDLNTMQKTFTPEVVQGETASSATLGATQIAAGMVASYFELKREQFGLFIKGLVVEDILPSFQKENRKKHLLRIAGNEAGLEKAYIALAAAHSRKHMFNYMLKTGLLPDAKRVEEIKINLLNGFRLRKESFFEIPEGFYDDVDVTVDVVVTGESVNIGARVNTLQTALTILGSNPALLQNRATRTIFFRLLSLAGVSPVDMDLLETQAAQEFTQQQGQPSNVPLPSTAPIAKNSTVPGFEKVPAAQSV